MAKFESFRDLLAWQAAMDLAVAIYIWTRSFPTDERFGLISQMRRSSGSVPYNIAEGWGLGTTRAFLRHLRQSRGSLAELDTQIELSHRVLQSRPDVSLLELREKAGKLLQGLITSLERKLDDEGGANDEK